jgi:purine-binding chemotaxis protein CheW
MSDETEAQALAETSRQILDRRALSLARETLDEEISDRVALLLFRIAEEWYAVRVEDVREIFQEYDVTKVPCTPDFIHGVTNVRGEILSVTDPARLMGIGSVEAVDGIQPPAVVITNNEVATALIVDEIGDIAEVANEAIEPPVSIIDRAQAEFVSGSAHIDGGMIGLLNVERLLQPIGSQVRVDR